MALRDLFKNLSACATPDILEPLLKSTGIDAALVEYDPSSRQVVLALKIHGQARYICIQAGRKYTRDEICALIAARTAEPPAGAPGAHQAAVSAAEPPPT